MKEYCVIVTETVSAAKTEAKNIIPPWKALIAKWLKIPVAPPLYNYKFKVIVTLPERVSLNDIFSFSDRRQRVFCAAKWPMTDKPTVVEFWSLEPLEDGVDLKDTLLQFICSTFSNELTTSRKSRPITGGLMEYTIPKLQDFVPGFEYEYKNGFLDGTVKTKQQFDNAEWITATFTGPEMPYIQRALRGRNYTQGICGIRAKQDQ